LRNFAHFNFPRTSSTIKLGILIGGKVLFDLIIRNGIVVDGTGREAFAADVGIMDGLIVVLGRLKSGARRVIDADGLVVSPGFIDIHAHTDELVIANPTCESKLTQGVTTEVSGNCGYSAAPKGGCQNLADYEESLERYGIEPAWGSMSDFLDVLASVPLAVNFATLVGHGTIRSYVMGYEDRKPTSEELAEMRRLASQSVREGAFGISSGLIYPPGCYADTEELIEICRGVVPYGGLYATHMRNEGTDLLNALSEALRIGRESGVGVQISHHKACGRSSWGTVKDSLSVIDEARKHGIDVWADQYPYTATSTGLGTMFPKWMYDGGRKEFLKRLADPDIRQRLKEQMTHDTESGWIKDFCGWEAVVISGVKTEKNKSCEGLSVAEIARRRNSNPVDMAIELMLEEDGEVSIVHFVIDENDVKTVMAHPAVLVGSDATARATTGPLSESKPHPRAFGTFARVLGKYVREEKVLSLEQAVSKMTGKTAGRLGLRKRGIIAEGYSADITVFDPERITDTATFEEPLKPAIGVEYVVVNGAVCLEKGALTDEARRGPGQVLKLERSR